MNLFFDMLYWHWLVIALVLITVEMLVTGSYYLIWMGISAALLGCLLYFIPGLTGLMQVIIFTVISLASILLFRSYQKNNPVEKDNIMLNRRGEQYVGRVFTLDMPIVNGVGKVKVDDSTWKISGPDLEAGTKVRVVSADGTIFKVEPD